MRRTFTRTALIAAVLVTAPLFPAAAQANAPAGEVRVDQVGYATGETKHAYLLGKAAANGARFTVLDERGRTVHTGKAGTALGRWNAAYPAVHQLDFSAVRTPGTYRVKIGDATSPAFRIGSAGSLFSPLAKANNEFFQAQRDGADVVPGRLGRKASHLTDKQGAVYDIPDFGGEFGDEIMSPLKPTGATIDVEGGWADAGDYVKFTSNSAYSLAEMGYVLREGYDKALADEVRFGLKWLDKVWDEKTGTLYAQVGIGTGSDKFGFLGDHDVWRLPEADDARVTKPGHPEYFVKHRPVFPANPGGGPLSPNLAGRVAAAFALGAQVEASRDPRLAREYLDEAASVFAKAKTSDVGELVTAFPHSYYPESSWKDDLELGATQLALAGRKLGDGRTGDWTKQAAHWAKQYLGSADRGTLNLYDTSAMAHADLAGLLRSGYHSAEVTRSELIADLRRQLDEGVTAASSSPFRTAVDIKSFDAATKSFGYAATARLYRTVTGDQRYDAFGTQQRNFTLGANAWGISLVVGAGSRFPYCPHHQVANLAGSTDGGERVLYGAVINGPNGASNFEGLTPPPGATACDKPLDRFDTPETRFYDNLSSWPSSEPAIDFTSTALLAFALSAK